MSATPTQSEAGSKRARVAEAPADPAAMSGAAEDRSVRQRVDTSSSSVSSIASSAAASSSSPSLSSPRLCLMRLAVVERQLVMQGLDITSLTRIASTCRQMRGEALHKEAGKFIPEPTKGSFAGCSIDREHPAHLSPLYRTHVPVTLAIRGESEQARIALLAKAAGFSRITTLFVESSPSDVWTEERMLQLLAQPWLQRVTGVSEPWLESARVQSAFFALPHLTAVDVCLAPGEQLYDSAVARARHLTSLSLIVRHQYVFTIEAIRLASSLTDLSLSFGSSQAASAPLSELIRCLPRTLRSLSLSSLDTSMEPALRSTIKRLFLRLPKLEYLRTYDCMIDGDLMEGMLKVGARISERQRGTHGR